MHAEHVRSHKYWVLGTALISACAPGPVPRDVEPEPSTAACVPAAAAGIAVAHRDAYGEEPFALGYPPYAIDGCTLLYVSRPSGDEESGELRLRNLGTGEEAVIAPANEAPRRPTISGELFAWEATFAGVDVVRVHFQGHTLTAKGPFVAAREPRAAADAVVFTGWLGPDETDDCDVFLVSAENGEALRIAGGPGQQRFADVSLAHVAFADFAEDPDGRFDDDGADLADVVLYDRSSGATIARPRPGKQAFPMLIADSVVYLHWDSIPPEPKLVAYDLVVGPLIDTAESDRLLAHVATATPIIRPTASEAVVDWVQWPLAEEATLWRGVLDGSAAPQPVLSSAALFGPAAAAGMTVFATPAGDGQLALDAAAR